MATEVLNKTKQTKTKHGVQVCRGKGKENCINMHADSEFIFVEY